MRRSLGNFTERDAVLETAKVTHPNQRARWRPCLWAGVGAVVLAASEGAAQAPPASLRHVQWPLLDLVVLPDASIGLWMMVAPNPASTAWRKHDQLVQFGVDPVAALQWATVARTLTRGDATLATAARASDGLTPPLRPKSGGRLLLLAVNPKPSRLDQRYVLVASDSVSKTHWKAFASAPQVDSLIAAFEFAADRARAIQIGPDTTHALTEDDPAIQSPVNPESIPTPEYPRELWQKRRIGRVWMEYVVGPDGRAEEGSFRALLSDDERFTEAAVGALLRATFTPASSRGTPVRQRVFQVITFRIGN